MRGRGVAVLRAFGALVVTLALVVGVPALLVVLVGNPFPSELPTLDEIRITLTQNGEGFSNFLISALAVLIWFIWAQLIVALVFEVVATVRHRETRRLPTAPGIQALAARLIAAMTLATTLATAPILAPAIGALNFDAVESVSTTVVMDAEADTNHPVPDRPFELAAESGATVVILTESTELWDLAEAAYGDGVQWKTIANANAGERDAEGRIITTDTELLPAGTTVALPEPVDERTMSTYGVVTSQEAGIAETPPTGEGGAPEQNGQIAPAELGGVESSGDLPVMTAADAEEVSTVAQDAVHVVEAGESMWSIAEDEVERRLGQQPTDGEVATYWVDVVAANQNVPSGDVDLIHPGDELTMPGQPGAATAPPVADAADPAPAETDVDAPVAVADGPVELATGAARVADPAPAPAAESALQPSTSTDVSATEAAETLVAAPQTATETTDTEAADRSIPVAPVALAGLGAALVATGLRGALQRRRALQRRLREPGALPRLPSSEAAAFEAALAHAASEVIESEQGTGWRMLPASAVAAVRSAGPMEMHADREGGLVAIPLDDSEDGDQGANGEPSLPIDLVDPPDAESLAAALGRPVTWHADSSDPGWAVVPTTTVIGTEPDTGDAVILDLASAGVVDLRGSDADLRRLARGIVLDLAVSDRADDLCVIAVGVAGELADLERVRVVDSLPDALVAAVHCGHAATDSTTPVVVVSGRAADGDSTAISALRELGAIVVTPGHEQATTRITVDGDEAELWPSGTTARIAAADQEDYRAIAELVDATAVDAVEPVPVHYVVEEVIDVPALDGCAVEAGPVEVQVLGPVEIVGAGSFSSVKAIDVVTYLAFHRNGVDADQIKSWVWPAFEPPTDKALANVMSRARTALGVDDDGKPYLSRAGADKTYRLDEAVTTDFDRVRALIGLADQADDRTHELGLLRQALELIRGVPFTGGAASSFAWADNHVRAHVEFTVDEAVHRCADLALELDDLPTARWAALKGLEVVPGCEQCFRRRFLVAGAGNNRTELRRAMADLERTAAAELGEPEAVDTISGELLELYNELDQALVAGSA